jgi:hypothetical protein
MDDEWRMPVRLAAVALRGLLERCERENAPVLVHYRDGKLITPGIAVGPFTCDLERIVSELEGAL